MHYLLLIVFFFSAFAIQSQSQKKEDVPINKFSDPKIREIYELKNGRSTYKLLPYLYENDATYRKEAALAFGSIQDSISLNHLLPLLQDKDAGVRRATAFAIGQLGINTVEGNLLTAFYSEPDPKTKTTILEAMGKCANERVLISLNAIQPKDSAVSSGLAWAIFYAGLRSETSEHLIKKSVSFLDPAFSFRTRLGAAHFLVRTKDLDLSPFKDEIIKSFNSEVNPEIRMALCLALPKVKSDEANDLLLKVLNTKSDYRMKVNALRALQNVEGVVKKELVFEVLNENNINVGIAAGELLLQIADIEDKDQLIRAFGEIKSERITALLASALLKISRKDPEINGLVLAKYSKAKDAYEKGFFLKALAQNEQNHSFISKEIFTSKEPIIKTYGMEGLAEAIQRKGFPEELKSQYAAIFKRGIESGDVALAGISAAVMRNPEAGLKNYFKNPTFLFQARDEVKMPEQIETYQEIQQTIDYLTESKSSHQPQGMSYLALDWNKISSIAANQKVQVKTSSGDFTIMLHVEESPATVLNFINLTEKNFYNGKAFHRVVPNFVVQGGDPRGDGWGSTNYLIRSEFNDSPFYEGNIGIASAGKDTESCQWFVMHAPAPHLNGRYTNFGKIVSGMEVVHSLKVGDVIRSMKLID